MQNMSEDAVHLTVADFAFCGILGEGEFGRYPVCTPPPAPGSNDARCDCVAE